MLDEVKQSGGQADGAGDRFDKLGGIVKGIGATMGAALGQFDDSIQRLKAVGEAVKNALGTVLLPQLQGLADEGVTLLWDFTSGLTEAGGDWN